MSAACANQVQKETDADLRPLLFISATFVHRSHSFLNPTSPTDMGGALGGMLLDSQLDSRLLDDPSPLDPPSLICQPMQVSQVYNSQPFFDAYIHYTEWWGIVDYQSQCFF